MQCSRIEANQKQGGLVAHRLRTLPTEQLGKGSETMGCGINGAIEVFRFDSWEHTLDLDFLLCSNYDVFSQFFGNRSDSPTQAAFNLRGRPENPSQELEKKFQNAIGIHSETWIAANEFLSSDWSDHWIPILKVVEGIVKAYGHKKVRLVFWFDN